MKKIIFFFTLTTALFWSSFSTAQTELRILEDLMTRFNDINDSGIGITPLAYYNFSTGELTPFESEAAGVDVINNDGNVAGSIFYDEPNFILEAGYRIDGTWKGVGFLPEQTPGDDTFTTYGISSNSKYIAGQTHIGSDYGGFIFDTETETLSGVFDSEGEAVALYTINSEGYAGGWVDRPASFGTRRVPAYRTPEGEFHFIPEGQLPEESGVNAVSHINDSNIMVGDFEFLPFIYDLNTDTFTRFELPGGVSGTFTKISENGIAVGYADVDFQIRDAIVYHPSIGDQPVFLRDLLADRGIEVNSEDGLLGTAISISPNGEYIVGWVNGPPMFAEGWIVYIDDLILGTETSTFETITAYPNPVRDILNFSSKDLDEIAVYSVTGQKVMHVENNNQINMAGLAKGMYMVKVITQGQAQTFKVIKE